MTLQSMKCFVAVAQTLNFARAAQSLNLTQPAVTQQIKNLEEELGIRLIDRTQYHIALTPAGQTYYEEISDILDRIAIAAMHIQSSTYHDSLHIGCESTIQLYQLSTIYRLYHKKHPDIQINNTELSMIERIRMITNGQIDVMFCSSHAVRGIKGISYQKLFTGTWSCVLPIGHSLSTKKEITYSDLTDETLILLDQMHCPSEMDRLQKDLMRNCKHTQFTFSGSSLYSIPMIEAELGLAIMPDFVIPDSNRICTVPFAYSEPVEYGIAWFSKDSSSKVRDFIQIARKAYSSKES